MHITRYTDYSLRVLIYLALHQERLVTIQEIADSYQVSRNHLMKVVHQLNRSGHIETVRGKHGGMRLAQAPEAINIGALVRQTEQDLSLVECFSADNRCVIAPACGLKGIFGEALAAFLATLDRYTLEDALPASQQRQLLTLLDAVSVHPTASG
ncbi:MULTISPECIES: RrF2 family transcriptional regulator [Marinobacter]|uniref:Rrf2 family transcriptional regulator n=1 Tax=Marinobacter xestospongiae TaxID=994319 RepID=A0ABU3VT36_9GAMM|nr:MULTISPECIES: Rrf2 family transcriptional regulator [Marinobacter]MCG8519029.1 Rrf2 family transcriptional regulator [Pseudomonadales bacterium]MCK7567531.1 Rrf2 family transcriptional regulator [Marinobacter xestospongiae]MDV2077425.1 Rrf2 family transcriptional regulator [Marinobacter xestospongiae]UDL04251.1 Rrf2 family transcriptional regulator [Marinobacter sp. CA1]